MVALTPFDWNKLGTLVEIVFFSSSETNTFAFLSVSDQNNYGQVNRIKTNGYGAADNFTVKSINWMKLNKLAKKNYKNYKINL